MTLNHWRSSTEASTTPMASASRRPGALTLGAATMRAGISTRRWPAATRPTRNSTNQSIDQRPSGDVAAECGEVADGEGNQAPAQHRQAALPPRQEVRSVAVPAAESPPRDGAGQCGGRRGGKPIQNVVKDGLGQSDENALENEGGADRDEDAGHLVLDQDAEAQPEEAQQDGGRHQTRDDRPGLIDY